MSPGLRIHGGELAGRRLVAPKGIRPSQGLVKEAIFNALAGTFEGRPVVDLYAGSGALGLEALSRGAAAATFVERDRKVAAILRQNLLSTGCLQRATISTTDAVRWIEANPGPLAEAAVVFLDPPYGDGGLERALAALDVHPFGGRVVTELAGRDPLPELQALRPTRDRRYGDTRVVFWQPAGAGQGA